jgi:hypothetical protein
MKKHRRLYASIKALVYIHFFCFSFLLSAQAQRFFGAGIHLTTPIHFDYPRNPYVNTIPRPGIGWGFSYKKEWPANRKNKWYKEFGVTLQGIGYYHLDIPATELRAWSDSEERLTGFPSILFGGGKIFGFKDNRSAATVGLEASLKLDQSLGSAGASTFGIGVFDDEDFIKPFFLRLNLGYNYNFRIAQYWPGQIRLYTSLSAQNISEGDQYIRNKVDGTFQWGRYRVNNSEVGMQLFFSLKKADPLKPRPMSTTQKTLEALKQKKVKYRISIGAQMFKQRNPQYIIPQVDSFSVRARKNLLTPQLNVDVEFPFRKNNLWGWSIGAGYGIIAGSMIFESGPDFPANKIPISYERHYIFGRYGNLNLGLSRRFAIGKMELSHKLSATPMLLFPSEYVYLGIPLVTNDLPFAPFKNPILEGEVTYNGKFLIGGEYNPEIYFNLKKQYFIAVGLVFNYTYDVAAYGIFNVFNDHTTYYGGMVQEFSKIGISARIGLQR